MIMWNAFAAELRKQAGSANKSIRALESDTGIHRARVHRAMNGYPIDAEPYLAFCKWMGVYPAKFWSGDIRDQQEKKG